MSELNVPKCLRICFEPLDNRLPEELQAAASISLNQRLMSCLQSMEISDRHVDAVTELRAIAA
ncbi:MAG: hypothetical protein AAGE01_02940, partial [Pseudomonadota bacterium]